MDDETQSLQRQLQQRRRNLYLLQEKAAGYGQLATPLELDNSIRFEQDAIAQLEEALLARGQPLRGPLSQVVLNKRIAAYEDLWQRLQVLARYDPPVPLTPNTLQTLSQSLIQWYFMLGGMYLADASRPSYFALKAALQELVAQGNTAPDTPVPDATVEEVVDKASALRASLRQDLGLTG
jgi:hypothetical protein